MTEIGISNNHLFLAGKWRYRNSKNWFSTSDVKSKPWILRQSPSRLPIYLNNAQRLWYMADDFIFGYTGELKCYNHVHFSLIFGNIAILTNSSKLISKITVAKLNSFVKVVFWGISLGPFCPKKEFSFLEQFYVYYNQRRFELVISVL